MTAPIYISVVIPSYNRARTLGRALDSVLAQSSPVHEIIVVDDGSSDGTAGLLQREYPQARYFYQRHRGVSAARNHGIRKARGTWIALLDSDDAWLTRKLERQIAALRANPGYRIVHSNEIWLRAGQPLQQKKKHRKGGSRLFERSLELCLISPSSVLIERSLLDRQGLFDESLRACEDYDLWLRITRHEPVLFVDEPLIVKHGGHADQLSRSTGLDKFRIKALVKLLDSGDLSGHYTACVRDALRRKIAIYVNGATKRGRGAEARQYLRDLDARAAAANPA